MSQRKLIFSYGIIAYLSTFEPEQRRKKLFDYRLPTHDYRLLKNSFIRETIISFFAYDDVVKDLDVEVF